MTVEIDDYNKIVTLLIGVLTVMTFVIGAFQWKMRQIIKSSRFQITTNHDIDILAKRIDTLCSQIKELTSMMNQKIIESNAVHTKMEKEKYELEKEVVRLTERVAILSERNHD